MEFLKGIDETTESPAIPEKIRRFVQKHLHGMINVSIKEQKTDAKKFKQLNKLTLRNKKGEIPDEDVEEICVGIMRVIEARDDEREDGDMLVNFQIQATVQGKTSGPRNPSIEYEFSPDGGYDDGGFGGEDSENPLSAIIEAQTHYISSLHYHLDESHSAIRDIANNNNQALKPLMDALGWMGSFYASGLQNQQAALALIYDIKKAEAEERGKTARQDKWVELLKQPLGAMGSQFMPWAMAKMSGQKFVPKVDDDADDDDDDDDDDEGGAAASAPTIENVEADLGLTDEQKANPVAAVAGAISEMLEADQWFALTDLLKKKEVRLMRAVMTAKTDRECADAYDKFSGIPTSTLMGLNALLTEEQRSMLTQLGELVKAVKKNWAAEEDE